MARMVESFTRFIFTKPRLDAIGPHSTESPSAQLELCDILCTGLRLAVGRTDPPRKTWFFRYRYRGRKYRLNLGPYQALTIKAARQRVYELRTLLARGEDPMEARRSRKDMPTFKEYVDTLYLPHARATVRRPDIIESRLRTGATPYFATRPLDAITRRDVMFFLNHMKEKTSATTANHHLVVMRRLMNLAVEWEILKKNPCLGLKKFQEPCGRDRFLSKAEMKRFLEATYLCPSPVAASLFRFLLFSGLRYGEAVALTFDRVHSETCSIVLTRTKAGKNRRVYLSTHAWAEIERMTAAKNPKNPYLFPSRRINSHLSQPKKTFTWVLTKAEINDFRLHDLRHTFASYMVQSGATLFEVQNALGHASSQMTQRYAHLLDTGLRARAEVAGQQIVDTLVANPPTATGCAPADPASTFTDDAAWLDFASPQ